MKLGGVVMARWGDGTQLLAGKLDIWQQALVEVRAGRRQAADF
jgi:hypothetical protein